MATEDPAALGTVTLRAYIEALFTEAQRATQIAERERESAAAVLRSEQQRAQETAEKERARAATVLADGLERSIIAGDLALRDHIIQQVRQIEAALESADKRVEALRAEMVLRDTAGKDLLYAESKSNDIRVREAFEASEKAISKAEAATDKRFDGVNAFREQLADQVQQFLPREVAEAQIAELRKLVSLNTERLDIERGSQRGATDFRSNNRASTGLVVAMVSAGVAVLGLIVVLANVVTT